MYRINWNIRNVFLENDSMWSLLRMLKQKWVCFNLCGYIGIGSD